MLERVRSGGLLEAGGSAVVLLSGGRDSTCLLDLAVRIRDYPPELVKSVRTGEVAERKFIEDHAPLYMDSADL